MLTWVRKRLGLRGNEIAEISDVSTIIDLPSATVAPLRILPGQSRPPESLRAETGVYTEAGENVQHSQLFRNGKYLGHSGLFSAQSTKQQKVLYCGRWFDHFGHFLLESLSRLSRADEYPELDLCWSVPEGSSDAPAVWQLDLLRILCGERRVVLINQPTRFESVVVPSAGFVIPERFDQELCAFFERKGRRHDPQAGVNVWLSRSMVGPGTGLMNSNVLDRHLANAGWQVLNPETLSIDEQLDCLVRAERVAGEEGSALHLLLLLGDASRLKVDIFPRLGRADLVKKHFHLIARRKGFSQTIHDMTDEKVFGRKAISAERISADFGSYLSALDIPLQHAADSGVAAVDNPLDKQQFPRADFSYLQIGDTEKFTFESVKSPNKTLITASGRYDPRSLRRSGHQIFEMDLQNYLQYFHDPEERFDAIVVGDEFADISPKFVRQRLALPESTLLAAN